MSDDDVLPTVRAADLAPLQHDTQWLIDDIWGREAVGILGGAPKCAKSWLGLDMAISVASSSPCLGRFAVRDVGPALVYLAEDALPQVRARIEAICAHRGVALDSLNLHVITAPAVRLDVAADQKRLATTIERLRPRLIVLDPLVRLHRLDENSSAEISALLGFLRELQRRHAVSIVVVHHMSKRLRAQLGQALRGSGDLHAWGDHNAYLTRHDDTLRLTLEHRSAAATEPVELRLVVDAHGRNAHLEVVDASHAATPPRGARPSLDDQILAALRAEGGPLQRAQLRDRLHVNNLRLGHALVALEEQARVLRRDRGWTLAAVGQRPITPLP